MSWEIRRRSGGDIMAGRGGELWPSQGHCTEGIFIDPGSVEGTRALTCTVVEVNSNLTVIVVVVFLCRVVIKEGEVLQIGLVQILIVFPQWICKLEHVGF